MDPITNGTSNGDDVLASLTSAVPIEAQFLPNIPQNSFVLIFILSF